MDHSEPVIALDMNPGKADCGTGISDAKAAHEFDFGGFEIAEQTRVVNAPAGVGIDVADAGFESKRGGRCPVLGLVPLHFDSDVFRQENEVTL
jgi:hypothetical protein